jgi:orotate phosphoribosyltransferase
MIPLRRNETARNEFDSAILRSKVLKLIKENSFFRGKITLASGKESDFYFDMKPTMLNPEGSALLSELIFEKLSTMPIDYVGGLAVGAIPIVSCLTMFSHSKGRPLPGFFVRNEIKNHGTKRLVEGLPVGESLAGKNVVILDDVTTTGGSAMIAVEAAKSAGAAVILVLSVVDRQEGASEFYERAGVPFDSLFTADEFLRS